MTTTLVTGAAGFTGSWMIDTLKARGHRVIGLTRRPATTRADETHAVDLIDAAALNACIARLAPDYVIHLAAVAFVGHADASAFYQANVIGTDNLLAALAALPVPPRRVLVASSANVYGNAASGCITEQANPAPVNHYACSKLAMEHMARTWRERLPLIITRPFNYTGPGQAEHFLLPKIVAHFVRQDAAIELGNLDVSRDFSDVRDVVNAYAELLKAPWQRADSGMPVNVCTGKAVSLEHIIALAQEVTEHAIEVRVNPDFVRANEIKTLTGSAEYLHQRLGHRPERVGLRQTLNAMLRTAAGESGGAGPHGG